MILLHILIGLISFLLTPVVILLYMVQSNHYIFKICAIFILLLFSSCLALIYGNITVGLVSFFILFVLQQLVYFWRNKNIQSNEGTKYVYGEIISKEDNLAFDLIISLVPLYIIRNIPFQIKIEKSNFKLNINDFADALLKHGKDTSIDVDSKDAFIKFRIV